MESPSPIAKAPYMTPAGKTPMRSGSSALNPERKLDFASFVEVAPFFLLMCFLSLNLRISVSYLYIGFLQYNGFMGGFELGAGHFINDAIFCGSVMRVTYP